MSPEDERISDDEDGEEFAPRSIFAAGWFRAVLVLTVLAIVVVIALPYLLDWFEPTPAPVKPPAARSEVSAPSSSSTAPPAPPASPAAQAPAPASPPLAPGSQPKAAPAGPGSSVPPPAPAPQDKTSLAPAPSLPAAPPAPDIKASLPPPSAESKPASRAQTKEPVASSRPRPAPSPAMAAKQKPVSTAMKLPESTRAGAARSSQMSPPAGDAARAYWVQVGLFTDPKNAAELAGKLRADGFIVEVVTVTRAPTPSGPAPGTYRVVRAGSFPNEQGAAAARDRLRRKGYDGFVTQGAAK